MRIALITPLVVARASSGFQLRLLQLQQALVRIAPGQVTAWDLDRRGPVELAPPPVEEPAAPPRHAAARYGVLQQLRDLTAIALYCWPGFSLTSLGPERRRIIEWVSRERPTHIVLVHPYASELIPELRGRARLFIDCHNVESDLSRQLIELTATRAERRRARLRWRAIARWEQHYFPLADEVWFPSEADVARQQRLCGGRIRTRCVPNALDLDKFAPRRGAAATHDLVLPASFGYEPNLVGARLLRDRVLPTVQTTVPDARLILLGRDPHGKAAELRREPDVIVTGEVPDTQPHLHKAGVVVVPILQGGGTRFKILEALALSLPVVTTPLGCEGLDVRDGEHLLIREIDAFPEAISSLLRSPAAGEALSLRGRALVEARYSWPGIVSLLHASLVS